MGAADELITNIDESDCVLLSFGEEFRLADSDKSKLLKAYNNAAEYIKDKNYFVLNICDDEVIFESIFDSSRIAAPFMKADENENHNPFDRESNPMWDKYMKWLSCTLNNKLLILEFGCLMGSMNIVRWPFEKTVTLNQKSRLIRINETCPFIPAEISERSSSIKCNSVDFLL